MKKRILLLSALLALALTACGGQSTQAHSLAVTVEADGVYAVSLSTEGYTHTGQNADNSAVDAGETFYFDDPSGTLDYTVSVTDEWGNELASAAFQSDFDAGAVELVVTEELTIQQKS